MAENSERRTCGAKTRGGYPCKRPPMTNGRCPNHGGKTPGPGPGHPAYKHGRHSKVQIPADLQDRITAEMADDQLLSLRKDIATLRVRLTEILSQIGQAATPATLGSLLESVSTAIDAQEAGRTEDVTRALRQLQGAIRRAIEPENAWHEVERLTERLRKLVATERDLATKSGELIRVSVMVFMLDKLLSVHAAHSGDRQVISAMRREFASLIGSYSPSKIVEVPNVAPAVPADSTAGG